MFMEYTLTSSSPLVMHSPRGVDPDDPLVREIAIINKKGSRMTPEDRLQKAKLQWRLGVYEVDGVVVMPSSNIRRCLQEAAKMRKQGTAILRAVSMTDMYRPVQFPGPQTLAELIEDVNYRLTIPVGIGTSRVITTRPKFDTWSITGELFLLNDVLDPADLDDIFAMAGRSEGLGDARKLNYGRFSHELKEIG